MQPAHEPADAIVALAQIATCPGQYRRNLERHLEMAARARAAGAGLVVFPELSLTGYLLGHGVVEEAMTLDDERFRPILDASREIAMIVGLPLRLPAGGIANAAVLVEGGRACGVHHKLYLPTYGMFDEGRFFVPGRSLQPLVCRLGRLGIMICEDAWHLSTAVMLARSGVDLFLIVAGGPSELDGEALPAGTRRWHWIAGAVAVTCVTPVLFTNRCGWEEGILFGGGSWAVDARGRSLAPAASALDETLTVATVSRTDTAHARTVTPLIESERTELWRHALGERHA